MTATKTKQTGTTTEDFKLINKLLEKALAEKAIQDFEIEQELEIIKLKIEFIEPSVFSKIKSYFKKIFKK